MEVAYVYTKVRSEFGKNCDFSDGETKVLESILPTNEHDNSYMLRNPSTTAFDSTPDMYETEINTERVVTKNTSMFHTEGGWPKDVDFTEQSDVMRFRKKAERDEDYQNSIKMLVPLAIRSMKQNNTCNIYEEYFEDEVNDLCSEPPSARGLAVFKDQSKVKRSATSINWHPEGHKFAASYSILNFQDRRLEDSNMSTSSYIWDITNSNTPTVELAPPSLMSCLRFNPKSVDTLVGGCYNGMITFYDTRKSSSCTGQCAPTESSVIEKSHHDPVSDVFWVSSKTGHQCASVSTDGQMMWWDTRKLADGPIDTLLLCSTENKSMMLGASSLEYNSEAGPTKYLMGTEQGAVVSVNLRQRKTNNGILVYDKNKLALHHGPIYSIQRNPTHNKYFMTVGDWSARIWVEDMKTPIITTEYHSTYVTGGCWSPTRAGVFYVTRMDGVVDVWDFFHRQNEVAYSHKVSDSALSSISVEGTIQSGGKLTAIGDVEGTISLIEVSDSLAMQQNNERQAINAMFERETKREKNLEAREKEIKRNRAIEEEKVKREEEADKLCNDETMDKMLKSIETRFDEMIKDENAEEGIDVNME